MINTLVRRAAALFVLVALGLAVLAGTSSAGAGISAAKCGAGGGTVGGDGGGGKVCLDGIFHGYKVI